MKYLMLPNVASIMFKEQEGAFLAGVAAALMTKSIKLVLLVEWKFQLLNVLKQDL